MSLLSQPNQWGDNNVCHTELHVLVLNPKHLLGYLLSHHPIIIEVLSRTCPTSIDLWNQEPVRQSISDWTFCWKKDTTLLRVCHFILHVFFIVFFIFNERLNQNCMKESDWSKLLTSVPFAEVEFPKDVIFHSFFLHIRWKCLVNQNCLQKLNCPRMYFFHSFHPWWRLFMSNRKNQSTLFAEVEVPEDVYPVGQHGRVWLSACQSGERENVFWRYDFHRAFCVEDEILNI